MAQRIGGENGGPFISHKRIMESTLRDRYHFVPLMIPRIREFLKPLVFSRIVRFIRSQQPRAVQIAGLQLEGFLTMLACKVAGVKTVLAIHGSMLEAENVKRLSRYIYGFMEWITVKMADIVYGVSDYVSSWKICKSAYRYVGTVYNLISQETIRSDSDMRSELGILEDDIVVVSTGRIVREKGYDILLEVVKKLQTSEKLHFVIAGDGAFLPEMRNEIEKNGMTKNVHLLGYMSDVKDVLSMADIFILCTHHETLSISILEACQHKLPIIATNVGGIPEIVRNWETGILVTNKDVNGFKEAIMELATSKVLRTKMGEAASTRLYQMFSPKTIEMKLNLIYEEVGRL